jgi:hypothetical protein
MRRTQRQTLITSSVQEPATQSVDALPEKLFAALQTMDREASAISGGPTGLCWYGARKTRQTSRHWIPRLVSLLRESGIDAHGQHPYPHRGPRCDLFVRISGEETVWIEIVGAWKDYCRRVGLESVYRASLQFPIEPPEVIARKNKFAVDMERLTTLSPPHAQHIGMLLVGFDSAQFSMDEDVQDLKARSVLGKPPWPEHADSWTDARRDGCSVKCWLWMRPV